MIKLLNGCRWQAKSFTVAVKDKPKDNPCLTCLNNKYRGGSVEICDSCINYSNAKIACGKEI